MKFLFRYGVFLMVFNLWGQTEEIENQLEMNAMENSVDEESNMEWLLNLEYYTKHPIVLVKKNLPILANLNLLSPIQIKDLEDHLDLHGKLLNLYELQVLPSWNLETIQQILPFVSVSGEEIQFSELGSGQWQVLSRVNGSFPMKKGYISDEKAYAGSPYKLLEHLRYHNYQRLQVGLTMEKDPGERMAWNEHQKGFDFVAGYVSVKGNNHLQRLILGDYQVQLGQGLLMWQGNSFGKSTNPSLVSRVASVARPYTSADEVTNSRGGLCSWAIKGVDLTAFYSRKRMDGTIEEGNAMSWTQNGLHRTKSELAKRKNLEEVLWGGSVSIPWKKIDAHFNFTSFQYDRNLQLSQQVYQLPFQSFSHQLMGSVDYRYGWKNLFLFGETASDQTFKIATTNGFLLAIGETVSISGVQRFFGEGYFSNHASALGRVTNYSQEQGSFFVFNYQPSRTTKLSAYADYYRVDWLRYLVNGPSVGSDYMLEGERALSKEVSLKLRYRLRSKLANSRMEEEGIKELEDGRQKWLRCEISWRISENVSLRSRWEQTMVNRLSNKEEKGSLLYTDLVLKPKYQRWNVTFRYAIFSTDSYDSRLYAYEANALYVYSVPAYFYRGSRFYCVAKVPLLKGVDLWLRYAHTNYRNRDVISSGNEEINGNQKHEWLIQVRWKIA
ncbi:MAG: hypothetical protein N4A41_13090 [Crocinitomicaceae bacterium]|nr:hypothetical protein [Crocinitomicaceae bacterium]